MTKKICLIFLSILLTYNIGFAKKQKTLNLNNSSIAVVMEVDNKIQFVKRGLTPFGDLNYESSDNIFNFKEFILNKFDIIFKDLSGHGLSIVEAAKYTSYKDLKKHKRKERKKIIKEEKFVYYNNLINSGYSHLLTIKKSKYNLTTNDGLFPVAIEGFGLSSYDVKCTYFGLDAYLIELKSEKLMKFNIKYPPLTSGDECVSGQPLSKVDIKFKKKIDAYSDDELNHIVEVLKEQIPPSISLSLYEAGIIKEKKHANELLLKSSLDEFLIVEKQSDNVFKIYDHVYTNIELKKNLENIAREKNLHKILAGYSTKSLFVYGDISNTLIPAVKNSGLNLYRTGRDKELISIK